MRLLIIALFALIGCSNSLCQNLANLDDESIVNVGPNITIPSIFELPVVEPHISAHPISNNHLLVAAMVVTDINHPYQSCRLVSFVSENGGESWQETNHDWWGYDPWTAILDNGSTVMTWLGTKGEFRGQFPLQFFSSDDSGKTWNNEVQSFIGDGHGHDGTKVVGLNNEFYFTTVRFNQSMGADVVLYRKEGKERFEEVAVVDSKGVRLNFCEPVILTDGTVIVPSSHFLDKLWVQRYHHDNKKLSDKYLVTMNPGGAGGYMRMAADVNQKSDFTDRIYFVRALGRGGNYKGIWLNYSDDKGEKWSQDTRIDLFENEPESRAIVPSIAINNEGVVAISWVDSQTDASKKEKDVYVTISKDGGVSFMRPERVTTVSSNPHTTANGDVANKFSGGGHYLGMTAKQDGSFQLVWSDSRTGIFQLQTARISVN